jgi:hypothetical protein
MSEQTLIADSRTFEQQMIERDKRATKAGFMVGGRACSSPHWRLSRGADVAAETDGR